MIGVLVNSGAIILGGIVGLLIGSRFSERLSNIVIQAMGLCILLIGMDGALNDSDMVAVIICLVLGTVIGELFDVEAHMERLGDRIQAAMKGRGGNVSQGFVTASLLFCTGAMALVGSINAGLNHDYATLFAKAVLDGIYALLFATTMGVGVLMSSISIFVYEGAVALLAGVIAPVLSEEVVALMSCTGGLLVAALGLNMVGVKRIKVGNMLPGMFLPIIYVPLVRWLTTLFGG